MQAAVRNNFTKKLRLDIHSKYESFFSSLGNQFRQRDNSFIHFVAVSSDWELILQSI